MVGVGRRDLRHATEPTPLLQAIVAGGTNDALTGKLVPPVLVGGARHFCGHDHS